MRLRVRVHVRERSCVCACLCTSMRVSVRVCVCVWARAHQCVLDVHSLHAGAVCLHAGPQPVVGVLRRLGGRGEGMIYLRERYHTLWRPLCWLFSGSTSLHPSLPPFLPPATPVPPRPCPLPPLPHHLRRPPPVNHPQGESGTTGLDEERDLVGLVIRTVIKCTEVPNVSLQVS